MSGWNEQNFLEKAMPLLEKRMDAEVCPDAAALSAIADGIAPVAVREAVDRHVMRCADCANLLQRLGRFDQSGLAGPEVEWAAAQHRLDGRMRQFVAEGRPASRWWKIGWMLIPVAAMATVLVWIPRIKTPAPTRVAQMEMPRPTVPQDKPAPGVANLSVSRENPQPTPPPERPALPPKAETEKDTEAAPAPAPADAVVEAAPSHPSPVKMAPVVAAADGQEQVPPPAAPSKSAPSVNFIRLNAGTRVWILLQSTSPEGDGGFAFSGIVLLPVMQDGAVLLDRETRVTGTGIVNRDRTTIRIAEFVWQGRRYRLRGTPKAVHTPEPGSGPAVQFSSGQVLETWLGSVSVYERVPAPQG